MSINQPTQHLYGACERPALLHERLSRWPALLGTLAVCLCLAGVTAPVSAAPDVPPLAAEASVARVNINTADAATLAARLKGVGLSRAQDIIRYREAYGPFKSVEELADVKGIGQSTLERNRTVITLD
ncbi:ComEA family DNA-binding protein [Haliea sp.]|uniref:ComEA family DNA-binding protein n=1 Tax=Haliea sp. TaxID=1932666 RepID=UPI003528F011